MKNRLIETLQSWFPTSFPISSVLLETVKLAGTTKLLEIYSYSCFKVTVQQMWSKEQHSMKRRSCFKTWNVASMTKLLDGNTRIYTIGEPVTNLMDCTVRKYWSARSTAKMCNLSKTIPCIHQWLSERSAGRSESCATWRWLGALHVWPIKICSQPSTLLSSVAHPFVIFMTSYFLILVLLIRKTSIQKRVQYC